MTRECRFICQVITNRILPAACSHEQVLEVAWTPGDWLALLNKQVHQIRELSCVCDSLQPQCLPKLGKSFREGGAGKNWLLPVFFISSTCLVIPTVI